MRDVTVLCHVAHLFLKGDEKLTTPFGIHSNHTKKGDEKLTTPFGIHSNHTALHQVAICSDGHKNTRTSQHRKS